MRWRSQQRDALRRRALGSPAPLVLTGPPGAGKTTLLYDLAGDLHGAVVLDLFGAASTTERLLRSASRTLRPHAPSAAARLDDAAGLGREAAAEGIPRLLDAWQQLDVPLLLDEPTEIRSLAYFTGLRDVATTFGAALSARRGPTVLSSSYGFLTRRLWPSWETMPVGPLQAGDAPDVRPDVLRVTFGWPRYVAALDGNGSRECWIAAMSAGGPLESACRATYETLLLRSRGYGITKALLAVLAEHEPLTLTTAVHHLGRTAGALRDYLEWLLLVDAAQVHARRYFYADGLVRLWVRLHAQGTAPTAADLDAAYEDALRSDDRYASMADRRAKPRVEEPVAEPAPRRRPDSLVEID